MKLSEMKRIVYLDMDGPMANFCKAAGIRPNVYVKDVPAMEEKGFFENLELTDGARDAVYELNTYKGLDLYVATKYITSNVWCASEKVIWIKKHFPFLEHKMHITCDKGQLNGDYLIDDLESEWKDKFQGQFIHFDQTNSRRSWLDICHRFQAYQWVAEG